MGLSASDVSPETLGMRIRQARESVGMSREQVAVALGISYGTVVRWETNRTAPSVNSVARIAALTAKPLVFFVTDEVAA